MSRIARKVTDGSIPLAGSILLSLLFLLPRNASGDDGSFVRDGVELFYRTAGWGSPVIFLSGGPGFSVDYMIPVAEFVPAITNGSSTNSVAPGVRSLRSSRPKI